MHYSADYAALFINKQGNMAKPHPEDKRYLCRFHPSHEILMCLYEIFEAGKKQDLTPLHLFIPIAFGRFLC